MRKTYVLDTNVLLTDPDALFAFEDNDIIVPMVVLEELDRKKGRPDEVGRNARVVCRTLDDLRNQGSLFEGVQLRSGGKLKVSTLSKGTDALPADMRKDIVDNLIIVYMLQLQEEGQQAKLVSKDINIRLKCDALNIVCEDYLHMRAGSDPKKFYRGVEVLELENEMIDQFFQDRSLPLDNSGFKLYANQIVVIKSPQSEGKRSAITRWNQDTSELVPVEKIKSVYGLAPRNKEQNFSLDLLLNPGIKLVSLVGPSGTGKTLLAIAAALEQHSTLGTSDKRYDRLIITRPVQPVGKDIGFLPGTLEEKMDPWIAPIRDNLNFLMRGRKPASSKRGNGKISNEPFLDLMQDRGLIEIEAITFIRGRSIPNSFIIIDESQNLSIHELKTIITRVGEGTKIVLTGDIEQIDNVNVDVFNNGLTYAVEKFKEYPLAGHVTLVKGERSDLATLASQIL